MERLTKREINGITYNNSPGFTCSCYCDNCSKGTGDCDRLKAMVNRLAKFEDLEEQGLLVRLPCKVNDKLYHFYDMDFEDNFADVTPDEFISEVIAAEFIIDRHEITIKCITGWNTQYEYLPVVEIGKTVFLTREEAEKKLEETKNGR